MSRLTRLVTSLNAPELQRFFTTTAVITSAAAAKLPVRRAQNAVNFVCHDLPKFPVFTSFATKTGEVIRPDPSPMLTEPPDPPPGSEDYVHIENPNPNTEFLTDNIVNVDDIANDAVSRCGGGKPGRKELPLELSSSVVVLSCESTAEGGTCHVYLVGTAHVSKESSREVQAVINFLKPEVVFLELCSSRTAVFTLQEVKVPTMAEMIEMWKKKHNLFGILYSWFLAMVANELGVIPGSEFRVAFEEARKYGAKVILGDRPMQITLQRTWDKMPLWHMAKLIYSALFKEISLPRSKDFETMLKEMNDVDKLTHLIQEMSKEFPTLMETLVHERDQ